MIKTNTIGSLTIDTTIGNSQMLKVKQNISLNDRGAKSLEK